MRFLPAAVLGLCFVLGGCRYSANFHVVEEGKLYRSAQLTGDELKVAIDKVGIKTIINLRGESNSSWYKTEKAVAKKRGVTLIDIPMKATRIPHRRDLMRLLDVYDTAERPMLVHCQLGADRTGEASAIYQIDWMGKSRDEALEMLTSKFHHSEFFMPAKRFFIKNIYRGSQWARDNYDPCLTEYKHYNQSKYCKNGIAVDSDEIDDEPEGDT